MASIKVCNKCKESLSISCFTKDSTKKDQLRTICTKCTKENCARYYSKNIDKWEDYNKKKTKEYKRNITKLWQKRNKSKCTYYTNQRRTLKIKATPLWLSKEQLNLILIEYKLAAWCTFVMNSKYEVDHIIPLKGKTVCGLHVPWNLQVIPKINNIKKSNKLIQT